MNKILYDEKDLKNRITRILNGTRRYRYIVDGKVMEMKMDSAEHDGGFEYCFICKTYHRNGADVVHEYGT